ncbi:MAG: hypothetical protein JWQ49_2947, partial [Edaphobacter sp.]|nr:hypothetical protein [Edaphobacter sp.]
ALRFRSERYSHDALNTFLKIELPAAQDAEPQPGEYQTIGQFYAAIADGIDRLCDALGEGDVFIGDEERQLRPVDFLLHLTYSPLLGQVAKKTDAARRPI